MKNSTVHRVTEDYALNNLPQEHNNNVSPVNMFFFQKITTKIYEFEGGSGSFIIEEIEFSSSSSTSPKIATMAFIS